MDPSTIITLCTIAPSLIEKFRDKRDNFLDLQNLDEYQNRFVASFEDELEERLRYELNVDGAVSELESNRDEILDEIGDHHIVNVSPVVETVTDHLTTIIKGQVNGAEVDTAEIETAVKEAYTATLDDFVTNVDDQDRPRLNTELNRVIQKDVQEISQTITDIQEVLEAELREENAYERYRIEWDEPGIESLISDQLSDRLDHERTFIEPPAFEAYTEQPVVLVYGRKGSGKTRALSESVQRLVETKDFDAVIYLNRSCRKLQHIESLLQLEYDGDVLVIWDDAHDIGDRTFLKNVLLSLDEYLDERGDHELWVRMAARRERLDGVLKPSEQPAEQSTETYPAEIAPPGTELGTLAVDTDSHFDRTSVAELVAKSMADHGIVDPDGLTDQFVSAIIEYEPTPAYIEAACQTIAETEGALTQQHIDSLPASSLESWQQAYAELRTHSQYGESRQAILKSIGLLEWMNAPVYTIPIVRQLSRSAFDTTDDFEADLEYLESRGWVNIRKNPARIEIHDIRLEAIDAPSDDPAVIDGVSEGLHSIVEDDIALPTELSNEYLATLNAEFAQQLQELEKPEAAETHYRRAALTTEATPDVHQTFAKFLYSQDRAAEARTQRQIAEELRGTTRRNSSAYRNLQRKIDRQLTGGTLRPKQDTTSRDKHTDTMLDEGKPSSGAIFTQSVYSESNQEPKGSRPMTDRERAKLQAEAGRHQARRRRKLVTEAQQSDAFEAASPPARLFSTLRRHEFDTSGELKLKIRAPDTLTGIITDLFVGRDLPDTDHNDAPDIDRPRVEQSKPATYATVLDEEFEATDGSVSSTSSPSVQSLVEIDSGLNKWLLLIDGDQTADILDLTLAEAQDRIYDAMDTAPISEPLASKLINQHCHVIQAPGGAKDELIVGDGETITPPPMVETAKVYPQPKPTERAADSSIATRVTVKELRAATTPIKSLGSAGGSNGVLLPTGERGNRVCFCGQILSFNDDEHEFRWTKLRDVFGDSILAYTHNHRQLEIEDVSPEFPVIVTGVPNVIETDDGGTEVALELSTIANVTLLSCWLTAIEVGEQTVNRIDRFNTDPGLSELSRQQYDIESAEDLEEYRDTARAYQRLI